MELRKQGRDEQLFKKRNIGAGDTLKESDETQVRQRKCGCLSGQIVMIHLSFTMRSLLSFVGLCVITAVVDEYRTHGLVKRSTKNQTSPN